MPEDDSPNPGDPSVFFRRSIEARLKDYLSEGLYPAKGALSLANCEIDHENIAWVVTRLATCRNLTTLNLASNDIDDHGAKDLAGSDDLGRLTTLDLSCNAIGPAGAPGAAA